MHNELVNTSFNISLFVAVFLLAVLGLIAFRKNATIGQFFLEDGQIKQKVPIIGTILATNLSLGNFIFVLPIFGYYGGASALWLVLVVNILAPVGFLWGSGKFKAFIEDKGNSGTVHQFIADNSNSNRSTTAYKIIRIAASFATVSGLLMALVLELHFTTLIFSTLLNTSGVLVFGALVVMICIYTAAGGFRAVLATDLVQSLAQIIGTLVLVGFLIWIAFYSDITMHFEWSRVEEIYGPPSSHLLAAGWPTIIGFSFIGFGWAMVGMDNWQRCCATRELDISISSVIVGFLLVAILAVLWTSLGIIVRVCLEPATAQISDIFSITHANPVLNLFALSPETSVAGSIALGLLGTALVMAGASTADTFITVSSHSVISDIFVSSKGRDYGDLNSDESQMITWVARAIIMLVGILSIVLWYFANQFGLLVNAADLFFVVYSVQYALMAPIIYIILSQKSLFPNATTASIIISVAVSLYIGISGLFYISRGVDAAWFGLHPADMIALSPIACTMVGIAVISLLSLVSSSTSGSQK